ncbi:hypothetical protein ANN_23051 [Periplaneta americana]|uniref:Uncharacterized protein n=1 Tax=Periplaneta americana TaxID=6978 RepID=A0ABQ8SK02_PERAM|nr:hypothetical protein ANN_23051 [Periplaneta americana]
MYLLKCDPFRHCKFVTNNTTEISVSSLHRVYDYDASMTLIWRSACASHLRTTNLTSSSEPERWPPRNFFIALVRRGERYNACSSALCNFLHSPVTSSLLAPNIFLRTLFSKTLNLCSSLKVRVQVSQPYRTTGNIGDSRVVSDIG